MIAREQQNEVYMSATRSIGAPRDVEYLLFSKVTGRLNRARRVGTDFPELVNALVENDALWRTIAIDVIGNGNTLPAALRAQLFYLYEFTRTHTPKVIRGEADAAVLIDINTAIMRGLRATGSE